MSDNSKVVRFEVQEIPVSQEALRSMSKDQRAMYAVLSLSYSELLAMQKVLRIGPQRGTGSDQIDQCYLSQRIFFIRIMSSKIIEVFKTVRFSGKENETDDEGLLEFRKKWVWPAYNRVKKLGGFVIAQKIRDNIGFHYDLNRFNGFCGLDNAEQEHSLFVSKGGHSQFFPYGEIAVACALGEEEDGYSPEKAKRQIAELGEFTASAFEELNSIFSKFLEIFVLPMCQANNIVLKVPELLTGIPNVSPFPLFFKRERKVK